MASIARRYSAALVGLCAADKSHEKVARDLAKVVKALAENPDVSGPLASPAIESSTKGKILASLSKSLFVTPLTRNFLLFLNDKQRLGALADIAVDFDRQLDEIQGRIRAGITSAEPLNPLDKSKIQKALEKATGKKVVLSTTVDPEILGGVVTRVGDIVLDGSVKNSLERMKAQLHSAVTQ